MLIRSTNVAFDDNVTQISEVYEKESNNIRKTRSNIR